MIPRTTLNTVLKRYPAVAAGGGVSLPTPDGYWTANASGNDTGAGAAANWTTYASGGAGKSGNCLSIPSGTTRTTSAATKLDPAGGNFTLGFWYKQSSAVGGVQMDLNGGSFPSLRMFQGGATGPYASYSVDSKTTYNGASIPNPADNTFLGILLIYTGGVLTLYGSDGSSGGVSCPAINPGGVASALSFLSSGKTLSLDELFFVNGTAFSADQRTAWFAGLYWNGIVWAP